MFTTKGEETILADLVAHTEDSARCLREAADEPAMAIHRSELARRAGMHESIIAMLAGRMREVGLQPPRNGTILGAVARSWTFFKTAAIGSMDAILEEAVRTESMLRRGYEAALDSELHPITRRIISEANAMLANAPALPSPSHERTAITT